MPENPSLAPIFVAAFAVQQLLEFLTVILTLDNNETFQKYKKVILGVITFAFGMLLAASSPELRLLKALGVASWLDAAVTGLVLSAGTEGINSVMKFIKYSKEYQKENAISKALANKSSATDKAGKELVTRMSLM